MDTWTLYWDYDRDRLQKDRTVWVDWLETRFDRHVLGGLSQILKQMQASEVDWVLIYAHSLFGAVEGLSSFAYQTGDDGDKFKSFCKDYFLPNPCPWVGLAAAVYHNFRCGLAHGFGIEKGGLTFRRDDPRVNPVFVDGDSFWVGPDWLLERLKASG